MICPPEFGDTSVNSISVPLNFFLLLTLYLCISVRCLLYSMRLWGDDIKTLRIASGTIFNEVPNLSLYWNS